MKKYILSALCALALIACAKSDEDMGAVPATAPETIYATFEEPTTRTYVEQDKYLRWHAEDEISFFSTTYNLQYRFQGSTGDNNGSFTKITTDLVTGNALANNYAVYPYAASTAISDEGVISVTLPATQAYAENSFGRGANTMVAATNGTMDNVLRFKNAGGYLKLQLYGTDVTVKSITLQGNKREKIAGEATITAVYGNDPVVTMADTATDVVTIDCGEGVTLSNDATTPTIFWFVLPETTFLEGFTVTVTDLEGGTFVKSTSNSFTIDRNMIQPMKSLEAVIEEAEPANNEIWYTSTDGEIVTPYYTTVFGANIISNTYKNGKGIITFDADVIKIGNNAFYNSPNLASITIPESVTTVQINPFEKCYYLSAFKGKYASEDGRCLIVGTKLQSFAPYNLTSYTIPSQVRTIGESAFSNCEELTSVSMSDNVTSIDHYAFNRCKGLKKITLSKNIWWMRWSIFYCCENLESIVLPEALTYFSTSNFYGCKKLKEVTILGKITSIPDSTFDGCSSLTTINIPESVTTIEADAFRNCSSLEHLSIPNSVTSIGEYAFYGCSTLKDIILPESLTLIDAYSFYGCESFSTVSLPASISTIGNYAFYRCSNLANVVCNPVVPPILGTSVFSNNSSARNIYVPSESLEAYRTAANWSSYADSIQAMQ